MDKREKQDDMYSDLYYPLPQGVPKWIVKAMETGEYLMYNPTSSKFEHSEFSKFIANCTVREIRAGRYMPCVWENM